MSIKSNLSSENILILGGEGLLGSSLNKFLTAKTSFNVIALNKTDCNIIDSDEVISTINLYNPTVIINCAAYTNVDKAEENKELAKNINSDSFYFLANLCLIKNIYLIQISTASIFNSNIKKLISGTEIKNPVNHYSLTKMLAEKTCEYFLNQGAKILVLRTYWLYGGNKFDFNSFINNSILNNKEIDIVSDQFGQPTSANSLCEMILFGIEEKKVGFYPGTNSGIANRVEWALEICNILGMGHHLIKSITSKNFNAPADRPFNTALSHTGLDFIGLEIPSWKTALIHFYSR